MRCVRPTSTCYLAEVFAPRGNVEAQRTEAERVHTAAAALAAGGARVRYLHSVFVPGEEASLHLLEAERLVAVEHVLRNAGVEAERISPAIVVAGNQSREAPALAISSSSHGLSRR